MNPAIVSGPSSWIVSSRFAQRQVGRIPAALDAVVGIEHVDHARNARLGGPAPRVAGQGDRPGGAAVIRPVAGHDLVAPGVEAGELDRVLVGLGAAVGEEEDVDVARRDLGQLRGQSRSRLRRHERVRVGKDLGLALDGLDHLRVPVPDVHAHQLAVEVEVALPLRRPEIGALGARHRDRVDLVLRRPLVQGVALGQGDHLVARHAASFSLDRHGVCTASARTSPPNADYTTRRNRAVSGVHSAP